jgi:hypothetical protein
MTSASPASPLSRSARSPRTPWLALLAVLTGGALAGCAAAAPGGSDDGADTGSAADSTPLDDTPGADTAVTDTLGDPDTGATDTSGDPGSDEADTTPDGITDAGPGAGCEADDDCTDGGVCVRFEPTDPVGICTVRCTLTSQCGEGEACVILNTDGDPFGVCIDESVCIDPDGDGYGVGPGCLDDDCDEGSATVNPAAAERCNGIDDDCDGVADDNVAEVGADCDTGFPGVCARGRQACLGGAPACESSVAQGDEVCNGLDDDCDGTTDELASDARAWFPDADGDRFGVASGAIRACAAPVGYVDTEGDCDDASAAVSPTAAEVCDTVDNDCDGEVDGADAIGGVTLFADADGDGWGDAGAPLSACGPTAGFVGNDLDCDDAAGDVSPTVDESCNGIDDDCDGFVDEAGAIDAPTWYRDADGDRWGDGSIAVVACAAPAGHVASPDDCNDDNAAVNPDALDTCDRVDNDCNGIVDDSAGAGAGLWYLDADGDGYGIAGDAEYSCSPLAGRALVAGDCNDASPAANPGADEVCDGVDNNCAGGIDENAIDASDWRRDADGDGFGSDSNVLRRCAQPSGFILAGGDCDDTNAARAPGRSETCDGLDNNCDGVIDDGLTNTWYRDADSDGFGNAEQRQVACSQPGGYVANSADCDDDNGLRAPNRTEVCDGLDNNCDGVVDDGLTSAWYRDADSDGFGDPNQLRNACAQPGGYVANSADCDDDNALRAPNRTEVCDRLDNNCNGAVDDGVGTTWYVDNDGDGFGASSVVACTQPQGTSSRGNDCNDANAGVNPSALEYCATNFDDDCDGTVNESDAADASRWYLDNDDDGQAPVDSVDFPLLSVRSCNRPPPFCPVLGLCFIESIDYESATTDCDDSTPRAKLGGGPEVCDGYDNDCNGTRDDGLTLLPGSYYYDGDGDGWGDGAGIRVCARPVDDASSWVTQCCDFDDSDASIR